jgi:hypothetical protein
LVIIVVGGYLYILNKERFNNPFIWCAIDSNDFIYLIRNFDTINFSNVEVTELKENVFKNHDAIKKKIREKKHIIGIKIDNKITAYYTHYLYDRYKTKPTKIDIDIFYNRNFEYVYQKYMERLKRMYTDENPVFYIITYKKHNWSQEKLDYLLYLNTKYKIIIITQFKIKNRPKNVYIINDSLKEGDPNKLTKKYFNTIKKYINN